MTMTKSLLPLLAALALAGPARAGEIATIPLERVETLGTRIETDTAEKTEGEAAIRVTTQWPTVVNLAEAIGPNVAPATLLFEADVKSRGLTGKAFLEMWCHFPGQGSYFGRGLESTVEGDAGWTRLNAKFFLNEGQRPSTVTLNLVVQGRGTVWVDNAKLSTAPLP